MKALITYSEEFDQLITLHQFLKGQKVKFDERKTDFLTFPIQDVSNYDFLIIQNQLNQDVLDPSSIKSNPGLEIVRELRANYRLGIPIVLISERSQDEFEAEIEKDVAAKYMQLIYSPGLKIFSTKDRSWDFEEMLRIKPLSPAAVEDINEMLIDLRGYLIDKVTHKLLLKEDNNGLTHSDSILDDLTSRLDWIRSFLIKFFSPGELIRINYENLAEGLKLAQSNYLGCIDDHHKKDDSKVKAYKADYFRLRKELVDNIIREIDEDKYLRPNEAKDKKYKVLLLDDDPNWISDVFKPLEDYMDLIIVQRSKDAIDLLKQDQSNEIRAVISDWRLYEDFDKQTHWQDLQGYDVLQYAARTGHRALIALTSLTDSVIHKIRNHLDVNISLITKDYIRAEENAALLRSIILDKCIEIDLQIASTPTSKGWFNGGEQSLHNQYIELRSSGDWAVTEHEISKIADEVFEYYMQGTDIDIQRSLEPVNKKFGLKLQQRGIYIVENCLIVRRVWLGLWWNLNKFNFPFALDDYPEVKIFSTIRQSYLDEEGDNVRDGLEKLANNAKQLAYNLGFVKEDLPLKGILPEEISWLKRHGIEPNKGNISVYETD